MSHQGLSPSFCGVQLEGYPCYAWIVKGRLWAAFFYCCSALRSFMRLNGEELSQVHSSPPGSFHAGAKSAVDFHGLRPCSASHFAFSTGEEGERIGQNTSARVVNALF